MRADRLVSILLLLQIHERLTAATLAERLEVSERTILPNMEALGAAGVPVVADRGWRPAAGDPVRGVASAAAAASHRHAGVSRADQQEMTVSGVLARELDGIARAHIVVGGAAGIRRGDGLAGVTIRR